MSEKVIRGNWVARQTNDEVEVPSWKEFEASKAFVQQETQNLWRAVDQLTGNPIQKAANAYDKETR